MRLRCVLSFDSPFRLGKILVDISELPQAGTQFHDGPHYNWVNCKKAKDSTVSRATRPLPLALGFAGTEWKSKATLLDHIHEPGE